MHIPQVFVFEQGRSTCVVSHGSGSRENGLHVAPDGHPSALYGPAFVLVAVQIKAHWVGISALLEFNPLVPLPPPSIPPDCKRDIKPVMQ